MKMTSKKSAERKLKSIATSGGDRRTGSVGERPELAGSRDDGDRSIGASKKRGPSIEDEIAGDSANDPGLGG
jgi:hypothetical protein